MNLSRFGRMCGMWRVHAMLSEVLARFVDGELQIVGALLVQLHKVLLRVAVDQGSWDTAVPLWTFPDPLGSELFAGSPEEMIAARAYKKAMSELCGSLKKNDAVLTDDGDEDRGGDAKKEKGGGREQRECMAERAAPWPL